MAPSFDNEGHLTTLLEGTAFTLVGLVVFFSADHSPYLALSCGHG